MTSHSVNVLRHLTFEIFFFCGIQESAGAMLRFCDVRGCREHGIHVGTQGWASMYKCHIIDCACGVLVCHHVYVSFMYVCVGGGDCVYYVCVWGGRLCLLLCMCERGGVVML